MKEEFQDVLKNISLTNRKTYIGFENPHNFVRMCKETKEQNNWWETKMLNTKYN